MPPALQAEGFDEVVVATGIQPRTPDMPGIDHPKVVPYIDAILGRKPIGRAWPSWARAASASTWPS
jgi:2,4-dienoyl-CoA reductase (NADPH2)